MPEHGAFWNPGTLGVLTALGVYRALVARGNISRGFVAIPGTIDTGPSPFANEATETGPAQRTETPLLFPVETQHCITALVPADRTAFERHLHSEGGSDVFDHYRCIIDNTPLSIPTAGSHQQPGAEGHKVGCPRVRAEITLGHQPLLLDSTPCWPAAVPLATPRLDQASLRAGLCLAHSVVSTTGTQGRCSKKADEKDVP